MDFNFVIGFDMGKESFDFQLHDSELRDRIDNNPKSIRKMLKSLSKMLKTDLKDCLFCLEHTGLYSFHLIEELDKRSLNYAVIPGLELKRSLGITRGKSDRIDAKKIALYAYLRRETIPLFKLPSDTLIRLKDLISLRNMHVRNRASYKARVGEIKRIKKRCVNKCLISSHERIVRSLDKEIEKVENAINELIATDEKIQHYFTLIQSIVGVGPVLAAYVICKTECFTKFSSWRKFACYCGTAPFPNESGKTKKGKRTSSLGDKEMKKLLTTSAWSASQHDPELRAYKKRKEITEKITGKITNAVRNKILARIFAVAKRGTPYVKLANHAA